MAGSSTTPVKEYSIPEKRDDKTTPRLPFKINGELFMLRMPKTSIATAMISILENPDQLSDSDLGWRTARTLWAFVEYVDEVPPEPAEIKVRGVSKPNPDAGKLRGQARIRQRLDDAHDAMDIHDLAGVFTETVEAMFDRPTGARRGSSTQPRAPGRASGGATRAKPAKTSTR